MVEVVFAEVVFGQVGDVGGLDVRDVGGAEEADVHCWRGGGAGWVEGVMVERGGLLLWGQLW